MTRRDKLQRGVLGLIVGSMLLFSVAALIVGLIRH